MVLLTSSPRDIVMGAEEESVAELPPATEGCGSPFSPSKIGSRGSELVGK